VSAQNGGHRLAEARKEQARAKLEATQAAEREQLTRREAAWRSAEALLPDVHEAIRALRANLEASRASLLSLGESQDSWGLGPLVTDGAARAREVGLGGRASMVKLSRPVEN
jgi:hypothetical protein